MQKAATASSSGPVPAVKPEDGSSLDALRRQLQGGAPPAPAASGAAEQPSAPGTKKLLEAALEEPAVARRRLFRLFLDVVGRTPTREEEREISSLPPAQRWPVLMRATPVRQPWLDSLRDASRALLGRDLTPDESREVGALVTRELPAAFWVSLLPAYAGTESRRPRSPQQRAASLIVDLTDRVPTSTEIEVVLAALRAQGSEADVARTLAYSPRSHLSGGGAVTPLEEEVFRFLLRSPAEAENARILEVLGGIPEAERRRWLLLTLASLPEYQTY